MGKPLKIGWINLSSFYADMEEGTVSTTEDVQKLLARLIKEKIDGLVLDLRGNGGGSLEEAIRLTGLFVPAGPVVQAKDWRGSISFRECENEKAFYDGPMIVLIDKTSASASEILAAALQDYRRALIVGDKSSFGKGTVQTILPVERFMPFFAKKDRAGNLKVTIQKFYRIAGGSTQLKGVEPELVLPSIRDVLDIGEASADNPLPYDTIPARKYNLVTKNPFPLDELRKRMDERIKNNPEFQIIMDESKRLKERIDRNTLSLNLAEREKETAETKQRREKQDAEREIRAKEVAAKLKDGGFKTYHLTLDNVNKAELVPESAFSREQSTGMRMAKKDDDEDAEPAGSKFPYGLEPMKLETVNILRDFLELTTKQPTTAKAGEKK
jgi:carboxyl-terminal processing protease